MSDSKGGAKLTFDKMFFIALLSPIIIPAMIIMHILEKDSDETQEKFNHSNTNGEERELEEYSVNEGDIGVSCPSCGLRRFQLEDGKEIATCTKCRNSYFLSSLRGN